MGNSYEGNLLRGILAVAVVIGIISAVIVNGLNVFTDIAFGLAMFALVTVALSSGFMQSGGQGH